MRWLRGKEKEEGKSKGEERERVTAFLYVHFFSPWV
jgi:hypothetical protein